jgi:histidinol-phosphatase (PHP family)
MQYFNHHTHTIYCDGNSEPEEYVKRALKLNFHTLGFSGHAPVPFENKFSIKDDKLEEYAGVVNKLKKRYSQQIKVYLSLEIDFIPEITHSFEYFTERCGLDYTIGGVHLVKSGDNDKLWFIDGSDPNVYDYGLKTLFNGNIRKAVETYWLQITEMVATQKPDIIAHIDKIGMHNRDRYFSEEEKWYKDLIWKVLKIVKDTGSVIEVNTRGLYKGRSDKTFPSPLLLEQILHLKIPVTLSSDAHKPEELDGFFGETIEMLEDIGFGELMYFREEGWKKQGIHV